MFSMENSTQKIENLSGIDLVVFDVDGVLIDTSRSFPVAVNRAVEHYGSLLGIAEWDQPSLEEFRAFKRVPGFNNDWDLAEGLLVFKLCLSLLDIRMTLDDFLKQVSGIGGGIAGVRYWLETLAGESAEKVKMFYHPSVIRRLAMEHYAGAANCERFYELEPKFEVRKGAVQEESVMVDVNLLESLPYHLGIYTGRNGGELDFALSQIGYNRWEQNLIAFDNGNGIVKPEPDPLVRMLKTLNGHGVIFIGDSRDDLSTVTNMKEQYPEYRAIFVQIGEAPLSNDVNRWTDINTFLRYLLENSTS